MALTTESRDTLRPIQFPWALEFWKKQNQVHWLHDEATLGDDVKDFKTKMTDAERNLVTQTFRFFTQSDSNIFECYMQEMSKVFKAPEIKMMLNSFSNMETIHIMAYAHLLDTLGFPESEYLEFMKHKEMVDKHNWLKSFHCDTDALSIAESLAAFSGATEGVSLFASFAILLNFPRHNKLKGMGDIISWSIRDETMHCEGIAKLFHTFLAEHPEIDRAELEKRVENVFHQCIHNEDAFIDLAFSMGPVEGMEAGDVKKYIRFIADIRLQMLGMKKLYFIETHPLPWLPGMLNAPEFGNFFETRVTEYSKASTVGEWNDETYDF